MLESFTAILYNEEPRGGCVRTGLTRSESHKCGMHIQIADQEGGDGPFRPVGAVEHGRYYDQGNEKE